MLKIHQNWGHSHPGAKVPDHSFYRYFLVVDDEMLNYLLQFQRQQNLQVPFQHAKRSNCSMPGST